MTTRIHISGIDTNITQTDLSSLLSKMGSVEEIYIPTKSMGNNGHFAIARIGGAEVEKFGKTLKALNGSMWKGCKIRLELAKEWYKDRIVRENHEASINNVKVPSQTHPKPTISQEQKPKILRIRKARGSRIIQTSPNPTIIHDGRHYRPNTIGKSTVNFATKRVFDENSVDLNNYEMICTIPKPSLQKTLTANSKSGKGVRKGFGLISAETSKDCCIEDDIDQSNDDSFLIVAPCVPKEDLLPENLLKERNRALQVLSLLSAKTTNATKSSSEKPLTKSKADLEENKDSHPLITTTATDTTDANDKQDILKGIFAKEGGVWWNNPDTVKDITKAEVRGEVNNDEIFKEAEQFGFDIRDNQQSSSFAFNFGGTADSSTKLVQTKVTIKLEDKIEPFHAPCKSTLFDLKEVYFIAKQFHRKRSLDDVETAWKNNKKNRIDEIKKKHRDATRQTRNSKQSQKR